MNDFFFIEVKQGKMFSCYVFDFMDFIVTRAKGRMFLKYNIRKLCVRIEPHYGMRARQYLRDMENHQNNSNDPARPAPAPVMTRRSTVSGTNLFNVDGTVTDYGSDFLPRPPRLIDGSAERAEQTETVGNEMEMMEMDETDEMEGNEMEGNEMHETVEEGIRPYLRIGKLRGNDFKKTSKLILIFYFTALLSRNHFYFIFFNLSSKHRKHG